MRLPPDVLRRRPTSARSSKPLRGSSWRRPHECNLAERLALVQRPRRLRANPAIRGMVRETRVNRDGLVMPMFIVDGTGVAQPIGSMPGISRFSVDTAVREARTYDAAGVRAILLFGIPDFKDAVATSNYDPNGVVQRAARAIKDALPQLLVIADLQLRNRPHGHCGILDEAATSTTIAPWTRQNG